MISEVDDAAFARGFHDLDEGAKVGCAVASNFKRGDLGVADDVAEFSGELLQCDFFAF